MIVSVAILGVFVPELKWTYARKLSVLWLIGWSKDNSSIDSIPKST